MTQHNAHPGLLTSQHWYCYQ